MKEQNEWCNAAAGCRLPRGHLLTCEEKVKKCSMGYSTELQHPLLLERAEELGAIGALPAGRLRRMRHGKPCQG